MKRTSIVLFGCLLVLAATGFAQNPPETNPNLHYYPPQGWAKPGGGGGQNLVFHSGGTVIRNANVVLIFWGPSFGGADAAYAGQLQNFRNQFGTTPEYNVITQYYGEDALSRFGNIAQGPLANQTDWFDTSTPPTNVTDALVQTKVQTFVNANGYDGNAVYEVVIPPGTYSSSGTSTSCGGPNLVYCAYHGYFSDSGGRGPVKYSIEPYPSCGGCQVPGFTPAQNQEHFICHETREAVTDALLNAWFDHRGYEADDKCAWSPTPFIGTGGFAYQYEWSNAARGCVKSQ